MENSLHEALIRLQRFTEQKQQNVNVVLKLKYLKPEADCGNKSGREFEKKK